MPKKSATTRSAAQRNRPKVQKSFEVVRQAVAEQEDMHDEQVEVVPISPASPSKEVRTAKAPATKKAATQVAVAIPEIETVEESETTLSPTTVEDGKLVPAAKGSAAARLAARRGQKVQQRTATAQITAEHYGYVRRDLVIIAILASIMFIAIIILYFIVGRAA